jgi:Zn-dependent peptidase ImmA (M78 family)
VIRIIYGIYKSVRDAAWQCLIDYGISSLPVDILKITKTAGIKVIKNSEVNVLSGGESGICILDGDNWFIIYDDEAMQGRRRFTIAHELGHIFLGHEMQSKYHGRRAFNVEKAQEESEADMFAARLLAPACVLWAMNLRTPEEIARVCFISHAAAVTRAERMAILYKRQKFLSNELERKVFEQFKPFINENKINNL